MKDITITTDTQDIKRIVDAFMNKKDPSRHIMSHLEVAIFKQFQNISFGLTPPTPNGGSDENYLYFQKRVYDLDLNIDMGLSLFYKLPYNIYHESTSLFGKKIIARFVKKQIISNGYYYPKKEDLPENIAKHVYWDWFTGGNN